MYKIKNENQNAVLLLHEIYGINQHIKDAANDLASNGYDVYCPNLLGVESYFKYSEEEKAYNHFMNEITIKSGFEQAKEILAKLNNQYKEIFVIGYSVGATIAWLCSANTYCTGVIGFYGSRIRDYCFIEPNCPTLLLFAKNEKPFNIEKIQDKFDKKKNITIKIFDGEHGFADRYCHNYNEDLFNRSQKIMKQFLKQF